MKKISLLILSLILLSACQAKQNLLPGEAEKVQKLNEESSGRAFDFNYDGPLDQQMPNAQK